MILLTAFKGNTNSSKNLLDRIQSNRVKKLLLTNSFESCEKEIVMAISELMPEYIISFGQKPNSNRLYIETTAHRNDEKLETIFDITKLQASLKVASIPYEVSNNAGNYLCNHVYFNGLEHIKRNTINTKIIFIQVPSIKTFKNIDVVSEWLNK